MGLVYTVSALVFGGWFIYESHRLYNRAVRGTETARRCACSTPRSRT